MEHGLIRTQPGLTCKFKVIHYSIACTGIHQRKKSINGSILTQSSLREKKVSEFMNHMLEWLKKQEKSVHTESMLNIFSQELKKQDTTLFN
jgi:hypothetical protein